jgi:hypothetical protein
MEEFEELMKNFTDFNVFKRSMLISNSRIKIVVLDKKNGLIKAEIQGNEVIPYEIIIDLSQEIIYDIISHDCLDFISRRKGKNKFCKHITKLFYYLKERDEVFTIKVLKNLFDKANRAYQNIKIDFSLNQFINKNIEKKLRFEYKGFEFFLNLVDLDMASTITIKKILKETKKLPAALGGYHGGYNGGLFDHILLVTNYVYNISNSMNNEFDLEKAVLGAIYHDFGKIPYYIFKRNIMNCDVKVEQSELLEVHNEIVRKFGYNGRDRHVEGAIAVIKNYNLKRNELLFDDEMYKGIIFHHGSWSKYSPIKMNKLATLLHVADMIASQIFFI